MVTECRDARVWLKVSDNGCGFPESIVKRSFEPYVTTKRSGTGLGLAVVKKIADDHGGRIEISNRMIGTSVLGAQVSLSLGCVANVKHLENTISGPA
jgi:nitrogen fixation/metabolism regulation signal transduction histidine kinase